MNDSQLLERLAATDAYAPGAPLPASARTRASAIAEIERSTDMQTQKRPTPQAPPRRTREGWLAAAAAFVVVLIVGAVIVFLAGQGDEDVVEPTTTTSATPTTITTVPPPPPPPPPPMIESWQRVGAEVMDPVVGLFGMTRFGSQLIAVGYDPGEEDYRQNGVIFASDDGVTWTRLAEDDPALNLGAVLMYAVTEGGPGLVAVGMGCEDDTQGCTPYATSWTSTDGTSWFRSVHDPAVFGDPATVTTSMNGVIATDRETVIAVGALDEWVLDDEGVEQSVTTRPVVWRSSDGLSWERVWIGEGFELSADTWANVHTPPMSTVAQGSDGGLVAVGKMLDTTGESTAAVWTSPDGVEWERIDRRSLPFEPGTEIVDVAWGDSGFVAVGIADESEAAVWQSPDGVTWTRINTGGPPFGSMPSVETVAALDSGYVAVGPGFAGAGETVTLFTSPDGENWDRVQYLDDGMALGIVVVDNGIAVAGSMPYRDNVHAAVWAGPRLDPESPPTEPSTSDSPLPPPAEDAAEEPENTWIGALAEGVSCEEIAAEEFTYSEALSYWVRYELTEDFDLDTDGTPCATAYSAAEIEEVFGDPDALSVLLLEGHPTGTFAATGPAVDAGLVCPEGTIDYTGKPDADTPGVLWRWEDIFTCDDGSGTFLLGVDEYIDHAGAMFGIWNIVSGTGEYETLNGGGFTDSIFDDFDASTGRLWITDNEN